VFANLLNNAAKYTNHGGHITVQTRRVDGDACVSIKDDGIGIAPALLPQVFDMFMQVDRSTRRSQGGLGIGLTLVKQLVQMHGGSIEAHSAGEGRGSEFVVRLPVHSDSAAAVPPEPAAMKAVAPPRRILVVDDNKDSAVSLAMLLEIAGNETFVAHDGVSAVEAVEKHRPEVVLLDIGLPRLSGLEVCRHVREQPWGAGVVVIALTGWGQEEDRRKSLEAGFDGHLVKPVDYEALQQLLGSLPSAPRSAT